MIETREMTAEERHRMRDALRRTASPRITDRESLWDIFLGLIVGTSLFGLLHEFVFQTLLPDRSTLALALPIGIAAAVALGSMVMGQRLRGRIAQLFEPHRANLEKDIHEGIVEVHSADDLRSYFDRAQPARRRDLVLQFPEGEVRVDKFTCEQEGISAPVNGRCRIAFLPRSRQIVEFTTKLS